ncbi:hypothetical protein OGH69_00495 [Flavobacterium sp. MFBS3-15]|uniref:hypothetical protein n=1 Tax=Flavobacterium sp. MFBS3-15 TaxID=2989816 RepID=UPI0022365E63|nr:hypothetical protein [Flavobacterium sp. MFBS3-15]MCW4467432.1 hypothetical protein [Flavobacterium sp. MFBS3-15]
MEEIFFELIFAFFKYPGTLFHWLLRGMTPSFDEVLKKYQWVNAGLSVFIIGMAVAIAF